MSEPLWCVHVIGPDEVHAMPSLAMALRCAHRTNCWAMTKQNPDHDDYVLLWANVAQWEASPESHWAALRRPHSNDSLMTTDEYEVMRSGWAVSE